MMRERELNLAKLKSTAAGSYSFGLMSLGLILSFVDRLVPKLVGPDNKVCPISWVDKDWEFIQADQVRKFKACSLSLSLVITCK